MNNIKTIGVIGGGLMGMSIANRLSQEGFKTTILEGGKDIGGLTSTWKYGDYTWDMFYHVILPDDDYTLKLIRELGLEKDVNWVETKTGFFIEGRYHSMSNISEFLRFPVLNLYDKFRLGLTIIAGSIIKDYDRLENIPVSQWLIRWSGKKTFQKIWLPLLKAKLGESYKQTSAAFICATIKRLYGARKKGSKKELFGYVNGGYAKILDAFEAMLLKNSIQIITDYKVQLIQRHNTTKIIVIDKYGSERKFDYVISTLPSHLTADLCPELSKNEIERLRKIKYLGVVCASLLIKKPLTPFYVTNVTDPNIPFTGVIEMTALVDRSFFGGNSLVYLPKYLTSDDPIFELPEDQLKDFFIESLKLMQPSLKDDEILIKKLARARFVISLPEMGYSNNLPSFKTSTNNLFIINSSFITDGTLNVNETLKVACNYLPKILKLIKNEE